MEEKQRHRLLIYDTIISTSREGNGDQMEKKCGNRHPSIPNQCHPDLVNWQSRSIRMSPKQERPTNLWLIFLTILASSRHREISGDGIILLRIPRISFTYSSASAVPPTCENNFGVHVISVCNVMQILTFDSEESLSRLERIRMKRRRSSRGRRSSSVRDIFEQEFHLWFILCYLANRHSGLDLFLIPISSPSPSCWFMDVLAEGGGARVDGDKSCLEEIIIQPAPIPGRRNTNYDILTAD